ncbi:MAG: DUF2497 domain-containing protein [Acetobacteraceae bacterium]
MSGSSKPEASPAATGDPSMEDILASIRRILSEEETPSAAAEPPAAAETGTDVLVLDNSMLLPTEASADAAVPPAETPIEPPATEAAGGEAPAAATVPAALAEPDQAGGIVAPEAVAAAAASVGSLLRTLASDRALQVRTGGPTIEDIVRQTLRPLLKEWLDAHLPDLVERLVRAEIERVVNRAVP